MNTTTVVLLVVLVLLALASVALITRARRRSSGPDSEQLQERFGPEYDRAVGEHEDRHKAEAALAEVAERRDKLEIRDLEPAERDRYLRDWASVQAAFVDQPGAAVRDADRLVGSVMQDRGYPVDDFDTKSDMVAVDHPHIAENYRSAHAIRERIGDNGRCDTEEARQAFVHYRLLFEELLAESDDATGRDRSPAREGSIRAHRVDLTESERTRQSPSR